MVHAKRLALTDSEIVELETIIRQRTNQAQTVDRSKMLLYKLNTPGGNRHLDRPAPTP